MLLQIFPLIGGNPDNKVSLNFQNCLSTININDWITVALERVTRTPLPSANNAAHSGFETQRRRYQMSKTGVSVNTQKGLKPLIKIKNKRLGPEKYVSAELDLASQGYFDTTTLLFTYIP